MPTATKPRKIIITTEKELTQALHEQFHHIGSLVTATEPDYMLVAGTRHGDWNWESCGTGDPFTAAAERAFGWIKSESRPLLDNAFQLIIELEDGHERVRLLPGRACYVSRSD